MNDAQKQIISQTCKGHTTTKFTDREFGRTCPSRLSKRELENLYFSLLDNNLELKQTINSQNEKIKQLSTRVQRLSHIQKTSFGRSERECCPNQKALIKEQKEIIADHKRTIDRLSERVKVLNMRLCSAKQFLGRNSVRCNKCCLGMNISVKNSTISGLNSATKKSTSNLQTTGDLNEMVHKNISNTKSMEVQTDHQDRDDGHKQCDENKCKTLMGELERKIVALEEELSKAHEDYLKRVSRLERELMTLRHSNGEKLLTMQQSEEQMEQLMQRLRAAEMKCDDINLQLSMEKRKVSELETRLKAADLSAQVAKTVERHLRSKNMTKLRADYETPSPRAFLNPYSFGEVPPPFTKSAENKPDNVSSVEEQFQMKAAEQPKNSDDSGYMEAILLDERKLSPAKDLNSELREKIMDLQKQLDSVKRLAALQKDKRLSNFEPYEMAIEDDQVSLLRSINDYSSLSKAPPGITEKPDVCEIKRTESLILRPKAQDSLTDRASASPQVPVANPSDSSTDPVTYKTNSLENNKGILDQTDVIHKTHKKDEIKMSKNVSYEDVMLQNPKNIVKGIINEGGERAASRGSLSHVPSDEKHNAKNRSSSTSSVIEKISTKKGDRDEQTKLISNPTRASYGFKPEKLPTDENKLEYGKIPHNYDDRLSARQSIDKNYSKDNTKRSSNKEQIGKGGKKISIDLPESDVDLSKPLGIEVIKSDTSYDRAPKSNTVMPASEDAEMKVLKGERRSTDMDVPKDLNIDSGDKKKSALVSELLSTDQNVKKTEFKKEEYLGSQTPQPQRCNSSGGTYVVAGVPSPRDTDGEISGLTDLPDERDESPRNVLSPGEERPTFTTTYTSTTDMTLSEGEMPVSGGGRKPLSPGERKWKNSSGEISPPITTSRRMEVALQAVSEELARCRQMLQRQQTQQERSSREVSLMTESGSDSITLGKAGGQERIVSDHSHSCRFTFHIGNIVLSDQAVTYYRGKALVLTWRFYDQASAMTRLSPGRILHFDFNTEYRLPITEHFLEYMRRDEMPLSICEIGKPEDALASCSLPLCGALKNINRRVYLSLTLVASPEMLGSMVSVDALDPGDEVGVLDVWCRLKVGPAVLPTIQKESTQSPDVTATPSVAEEKPGGSNPTTPLTHRDVVQKVVSSSAQDVRRAVAREIQTPSKLRILFKYINDLGKKISDGQKKSVTIEPERNQLQLLEAKQRELETRGGSEYIRRQTIDITVVWLALKEGCEAMARKDVQRLYVAYSFLGRGGAELETPVSLPKPKDSTEKCFFNFKKTFQVNESDLPILGHMAKCRVGAAQPLRTDCLTFTVVSEPPDDPLGLATCEDIGYAHLYLGDVLSRCEDSDSYTDVVSVKGAHTSSACGVLAVRVAGLQALRHLW